MNNIKKIGLTALAGSLVAFSASAAEMAVSGATSMTYTQRGPAESTGNPLGLKTNIAFNASGEVNGYTVSYMQTSADQFAGMSSARLGVDMGDMGNLSFDQGSGSGLSTIDDVTPTAAEEIWDGLNTSTSGRVGAVGSSGVVNYVNTFAGVKFNGAARKGTAGSAADGGTTADTVQSNGSGYDFALTTNGAMVGLDGLDLGAGYGNVKNPSTRGVGSGQTGEKQDVTAFVKYAFGPVSTGYQMSYEDNNFTAGGAPAADQEAARWGLAFNINESLSVSYGEAETDFINSSAADVTEKVTGYAVAYTMGSIKLAGNVNDGANMGGTVGANDENTEIALSFAF